MLRYLKSPSIHQTTFLVIVFAAIFAIVSALVVIYTEVREMDKQILVAKKQYIKKQKEALLLQSRKLKNATLFLEKNRSKIDIKKDVHDLTKALFKESDGFAFVFDGSGKYIYKPNISKKQSFVLKKAEFEKKISSLVFENSGFHELNFKDNEKGLVFITALDSLGWIVGSGVYLNELNDLVLAKKEEFHRKITTFILKILTLTFFLYMAGILKYRYLTKQITKDIAILDRAFKVAPETYQFVDETKVSFEEFKEISIHANKMIAKIREKNRDLILLNKNLEKIVEEKTGELQESIAYTKELLKQQDKFVNNAIHEINTPLSIMLMNIELHNLKMPKSPYLTKIEAAAKVLENIYEDLGYVVKKSRMPYPKERLNVSEFLKERIAYFHDVAEGNDLSFSVKIHPDIFIVFSFVELQRIIDNNLSNAIKYAKTKSAIEVSLSLNEKEIWFTVSNIGKTVKQPHKLFERYYREDEARGGFGLGLNIVREICDENGIIIDVDSKNGKTTFNYIFPKED